MHAKGLWKYDLMFLAAIGGAMLIGRLEQESVQVTAAHERAAYERKTDVKPVDAVWMRLPLECQTWIAKCNAGQGCKTRYTCAADLTRRAAK